MNKTIREVRAERIYNYLKNKIDSSDNNHNVLGVEMTEIYGQQAIELLVKGVTQFHVGQFPTFINGVQINLKVVPKEIESTGRGKLFISPGIYTIEQDNTEAEVITKTKKKKN